MHVRVAEIARTWRLKQMLVLSKRLRYIHSVAYHHIFSISKKVIVPLSTGTGPMPIKREINIWKCILKVDLLLFEYFRGTAYPCLSDPMRIFLPVGMKF